MSVQVLVAGVHRSGTSMIAGVLHQLGLPTGPRAPEEAFAPESNPLGQFEDNEFVDAFNRAFGSWLVPRQWNVDRADTQKFKDLIAARDAVHTMWVLKTPQLCYAGVYLLPHLSNGVVIFPQRKIEASARSLAKRNDLPIEAARHVIARDYVYLREFEYSVNATSILKVGVHYEWILKNPKAFVNSVVETLKLKPSKEQREAAVAFIRPDLNHHGHVQG